MQKRQLLEKGLMTGALLMAAALPAQNENAPPFPTEREIERQGGGVIGAVSEEPLVSIAVNNVRLEQAVEILADQVDVPIQVDPRAANIRVTALQQNVKVGEALEALTAPAGLNWGNLSGGGYAILPPGGVRTDERGRIELENATIREAIDFIAREQGVQIEVFGDLPDIRKSTRIRPQSTEDILDQLTGARSKMVWFKTPEGYAVATEDWYKTNLLINETITKIFRLEHLGVNELEQALQPLLTPGASSMTADNRTNKIIVVDTPQAIERIESLIAELDVPADNRPEVRPLFGGEDDLRDAVTKAGIAPSITEQPHSDVRVYGLTPEELQEMLETQMPGMTVQRIEGGILIGHFEEDDDGDEASVSDGAGDGLTREERIRLHEERVRQITEQRRVLRQMRRDKADQQQPTSQPLTRTPGENAPMTRQERLEQHEQKIRDILDARRAARPTPSPTPIDLP